MDERTIDDDTPVSPADALAIIDGQQARVSNQFGWAGGPYFVLWGAAWIVIGLLAFFNATGVVTGWTAAILGIVTILIAGGTSAWIGIRAGRGIVGSSARQGMLYGLSWPIVMTLVGVFVGVSASTLGLTDEQMTVLVPAVFALVAGALYSAAGAIWQHVPNWVLGLWIVAVGVISVVAGAPANTLVFGFGAGGGMLAVGASELLRRSR